MTSRIEATPLQAEAINVIGLRWVEWMGYPPRDIKNHWGAAAEAVDALIAEPALLRQLLAVAEASDSDEREGRLA